MAKDHHPQGPPREEEEEEDEEEEEEELEAQVHGKPKMVQVVQEDTKHIHTTTDDATSYRKAPKRGHICAVITLILLLIGLTFLILWLIYRPTKPHFTVVSVAIYNLSTTSPTLPPPFITTSMQFTIITRNPNKRTALYYDHLSATVYYQNQAITPPLPLPPLYHETKSTVLVSPVLGGVAVPVAMEVANGLVGDVRYGVMGLRLAFVGRVKYKAGVFKTGHYGVLINCDMLVGFRKGRYGQVPLLGNPGCKVDT